MSDKPMAVICFYWQGDRWREKGFQEAEDHVNYHAFHLSRAGQISHSLPTKYVNNLFRGVTRFATEPFEFICFTNQDLPGLDEQIIIKPFQMITKMGVIPRLYMFSEESGLFGRQVLALDLDIIIVGPLTNIMGYKGPFCARSKFKPGMEHMLDGDVISYQAGPKNCKRLWLDFIANQEWAEDYTKGRERFWYRHIIGDEADRWDQYAPRQVLSYKRHVKGNEKMLKGASIVSCHGIPRPHEIKLAWRKKYWN